MDDATIWMAIGSAVLGLLSKIVFDWLGGGRKKANGTSGERDVSFWEAKFQKLENILRARDSLFVKLESDLEWVKDALKRLEEAVRLRRR